MPVTNYVTVRGRIISEITDGQVLNYHSDMLGNVHMLTDQNGDVVKTMRYKPFGEVLSRVGSIADRAYQWVGSYGYRATTSPSSSHYVRARHYSAKGGSWTTVDPLWPDESAYGYVIGEITVEIDFSGLQSMPKTTSKSSQRRKPPRRRIELPPEPLILPVNPMDFSYGQYCGSAVVKNPGWGVNPQDCVDSCCMVHDRCLEAHYGGGYGGAAAHKCCDGELAHCVKNASRSGCCSKSPLRNDCEKAAALIFGSMSLLFDVNPLPSVVPCLPPSIWGPLIIDHWGDRKTCVPKGAGS